MDGSFWVKSKLVGLPDKYKIINRTKTTNYPTGYHLYHKDDGYPINSQLILMENKQSILEVTDELLIINNLSYIGDKFNGCKDKGITHRYYSDNIEIKFNKIPFGQLWGYPSQAHIVGYINGKRILLSRYTNAGLSISISNAVYNYTTDESFPIYMSAIAWWLMKVRYVTTCG